jgi:hypothetical protein
MEYETANERMDIVFKGLALAKKAGNSKEIQTLDLHNSKSNKTSVFSLIWFIDGYN